MAKAIDLLILLLTPARRCTFIAAAVLLPAVANADELLVESLDSALCQRVADLENAKQLNTIVVPFGEVDIDNDGVAEVVSEVRRSIQIIDDGVNSGPITCSGCGDVLSTGPRVLRIDGRHYIAEYSRGLLGALWQAADSRKDFYGPPICAFLWDFTATLEGAAGGERPVCQALLSGHVQPNAPAERPYPSRNWPVLVLSDRLKKAAGSPSEVRARSDPIAADIDNDGDIDSLVRGWFVHMGGGSCTREMLMFLDEAGSVQDSPSNAALLAAQAASSCDDPRFAPFVFDGRTYIEGRNEYEIEANPSPLALPRSQYLPYWTVLEWQGDKPIEVCRFEFERRVRAVPLR